MCVCFKTARTGPRSCRQQAEARAAQVRRRTRADCRCAAAANRAAARPAPVATTTPATAANRGDVRGVRGSRVAATCHGPITAALVTVVRSQRVSRSSAHTGLGERLLRATSPARRRAASGGRRQGGDQGCPCRRGTVDAHHHEGTPMPFCRVTGAVPHARSRGSAGHCPAGLTPAMRDTAMRRPDRRPTPGDRGPVRDATLRRGADPATSRSRPTLGPCRLETS